MSALTRNGFICLLVVCALLFALDTVLTLYSVLHLQSAVEINPLMNAALRHSPTYFVITKILVSAFFLTAMWRGYSRRWVQQALLLSVGFNGCLITMQLLGLYYHHAYGY